MARISKRVREDAILICDISASTGVGGRVGTWLHYSDVVMPNIGMDWLGREHAAWALACEAFEYVRDQAYRFNGYRAVDAEAAQLLREGWAP